MPATTLRARPSVLLATWLSVPRCIRSQSQQRATAMSLIPDCSQGSRERVDLEHFLSIGSLVEVKWLKTIAVFWFLAVWLAASNHCRLEQVPGLNFLSCCEQGDGVPGQDSDCQTDGCAAVEGGFYKAGDRQPALSPPVTVLAISLAPSLDECRQVTPSCFRVSAFPPPELPVTWQFSFRAAASPRAPSLVS